MAFWLRRIRKSKWYKHSDVDWLPPGEIQADAMSDISTNSNNLSVWWIDDNQTNLAQVIAALSAKRDHIDEFSYALIPISEIYYLNIKSEQNIGDTPDQYANNSWHWNLLELTASNLLNLGKIIANGDINHGRYTKNMVKKNLNYYLNQGNLDPNKISSRIRVKLN